MNKPLDEFHYLVRIFLKSGDVFCTKSMNMQEARNYLSNYSNPAETFLDFVDLDSENSFGNAIRVFVSRDNISYLAIEDTEEYKKYEGSL